MSRIHRLKCDGCGDEEDLEKKPISPGMVGSTIKRGSVRFELPEGWEKIDGRDVCPECIDRVEEIIGDVEDE